MRVCVHSAPTLACGVWYTVYQPNWYVASGIQYTTCQMLAAAQQKVPHCGIRWSRRVQVPVKEPGPDGPFLYPPSWRIFVYASTRFFIPTHQEILVYVFTVYCFLFIKEL